MNFLIKVLQLALFMLITCIPSVGMKPGALVKEFAMLLKGNTTKLGNLRNGILTERCAANQTEHNRANEVLCPGMYHCLPFNGYYMVICKKPEGLYSQGTYPVIDNITKNFDAIPCPQGTYQPKLYKTNDFGIYCRDKRRMSNKSTPTQDSDNNKNLNMDHMITTGVIFCVCLLLVIAAYIVYGTTCKRQNSTRTAVEKVEENCLVSANDEHLDDSTPDVHEYCTKSSEKHCVQETIQVNVEKGLVSANDGLLEESTLDVHEDCIKSFEKHSIQETSQGDQSLTMPTEQKQSQNEQLDMDLPKFRLAGTKRLDKTVLP